MIIKVKVKQLGSKRDKIKGIDFSLDNTPETVEELIVEAVHTCVIEYNRRFSKTSAEPLTESEINEKSELGKIAFGINYGDKRADEKKAAETALQAYEDGIFRIFISENECGGLKDKITLSKNDSVTFIRLTMLSGRNW